jgi:putative Mg2+ transporter-C (MgtC) family protein
MPTATEFALRVLAGGLLGSVIGFERQWRQRGAGVHTSALVAIGAALFTLLGPVVGSDSETRILANIVTGVGFLAGGVILRQGASITGLNTAATIWATAAVGALAGVGQFWHAAMGAAGIVGFNLALQPLVEKIDSSAAVYQERHGAKTYRIHAGCDDAAIDDVRAAVVDIVKTNNLILHSISSESTDHGQEVKVELRLGHRDDPIVERFSSSLAQRPTVRNIRWRMLDS